MKPYEAATDLLMSEIWIACQEKGINTVTRVDLLNCSPRRWDTLALHLSPRGTIDAPFKKKPGEDAKQVVGRPNDAPMAISLFMVDFRKWLAEQDGDTLELRAGPEVTTNGKVIPCNEDAIDPVEDVTIYMRCRVSK